MKRQVIGDGTMPERTGRGTRREGCGYLFSVFDGTLSGFRFNGPPTQGSSFLATLGWRTQSLWDWEGAKHIRMPALPGGSYRIGETIAIQNSGALRLFTQSCINGIGLIPATGDCVLWRQNGRWF